MCCRCIVFNATVMNPRREADEYFVCALNVSALNVFVNATIISSFPKLSETLVRSAVENYGRTKQLRMKYE